MKEIVLSCIDRLLEIVVIYSMTSLASSLSVDSSIPYMVLFGTMIITGSTLLTILLGIHDENVFAKQTLTSAVLLLVNPIVGLLSYVPVIFSYVSKKFHLEKVSTIVYVVLYSYLFIHISDTGSSEIIYTDILFMFVILSKQMPRSIFTSMCVIFAIGNLMQSNMILKVMMILCVVVSYGLKKLKIDELLSCIFVLLIGNAIHAYVAGLLVMVILVEELALPYLCKLSTRYSDRLYHGIRYFFLGVYAISITYLCSNGTLSVVASSSAILLGTTWLLKGTMEA